MYNQLKENYKQHFISRSQSKPCHEALLLFILFFLQACFATIATAKPDASEIALSKASTQAVTSALQSTSDSTLQQQRQLYQSAQKAYGKRKHKRFDSMISQLKDYPLYPYLEFQRISRNPAKINSKVMIDFAKSYDNTPLARRLRSIWLSYLAKKKLWNSFLTHYPQTQGSTIQQCQRLQALYETGKKQQALSEVKALWIAPKSQPKKCDPIFRHWVKSNQFKEDYAWQRFWMALERGNRTLARYLTRFIKAPSLHESAQTALNLHKLPRRLKQLKLATNKPGYTKTITITLKRLIRSDPEQAMEQWRKRQPELKLSAKENTKLKQQLGLYLLRSYHPKSKLWLAQLDKNHQDQKLSEWRLRYHLKNKDWNSVDQLISALPDNLKKEGRWRYWQARAWDQQGQAAKAKTQLSELAQQRSFYGFLAADLLRRGYQLNDQSPPIDSATMQQLAVHSGLIRARELSIHDQPLDARREWWLASKGFSKAQNHAASDLARHWNLPNLSIKSTISARQWNNLTLRFPTPYDSTVTENSKRYSIDKQWVYAVTRQESAFAADVRSRAGAVGLMQLMPATAKQTAHEINIKYRGSFQLKAPSYNVRLGSAYLAKMLKRFNDNRVYATAAYNAGPHRVKRWLNERGQLPIDIWIETIPFNETRQYVQNVLSYAVIYSDILGEPLKFLATNELAQLKIGR
ncbi:MAG: transglycosylase SLT domain-containing protein [Motiliproteus sp.]